MINIKTELQEWVVDYIVDTIHSLTSDSEEFNAWAKSFERDEAELVVNMKFNVDFGYDERESITDEEAQAYADKLLTIIINAWYM